jgi:hypothetical protein
LTSGPRKMEDGAALCRRQGARQGIGASRQKGRCRTSRCASGQVAVLTRRGESEGWACGGEGAWPVHDEGGRRDPRAATVAQRTGDLECTLNHCSQGVCCQTAGGQNDYPRLVLPLEDSFGCATGDRIVLWPQRSDYFKTIKGSHGQQWGLHRHRQADHQRSREVLGSSQSRISNAVVPKKKAPASQAGKR